VTSFDFERLKFNCLSIAMLWRIGLKWRYVGGLMHDNGLLSCVDELWQWWEFDEKFG